MEAKTITFKITKGMSLDLDKQTSSPETAYELLNIKTLFNEEESATTLVTEKGSKICELKFKVGDSTSSLLTLPYEEEDGAVTAFTEILGYILCGYNQIVLFTQMVKKSTKEVKYLSIYKVTLLNNDFTVPILTFKLLAQGNFNISSNIQGVFNYENSELLKVYWVDGVNTLRFLNIADSNPLFSIDNKDYNGFYNWLESYLLEYNYNHKRTHGLFYDYRDEIKLFILKIRNKEFKLVYKRIGDVVPAPIIPVLEIASLDLKYEVMLLETILTTDIDIVRFFLDEHKESLHSTGYITITDAAIDKIKSFADSLYIIDPKLLESKPDFILDHHLSVEKSEGNGVFPAGVILYAFTYFNKYGAETNIVDVSPLYYITAKDRGLSPEEKASCSFNVSILNPDTSFEYIRVYSILRTSLNATPIVRIVKDIKIQK